MKLKKIKYPSFSEVKRLGRGRDIVEGNPFINLIIGDDYDDQKCIQLISTHLYAMLKGGVVKSYDLTADGYAAAKEDFERLTLKGFDLLLDQWFERE